MRSSQQNQQKILAFIKEEMQQERELILPEEAMFESLMLGLRTTMGVSESLFENQHGVSLRTRYGDRLESLVRDGLGWWKDGCFALTPRGIEVQNEVLMRLMD